MEESFRNMEEYFDARGAFGDQGVDAHLSIDPRAARDSECVFVDARDGAAYGVSRVGGAVSLPGHTMAELYSLTGDHPTIRRLSAARSKRIVVYSDNGTQMSRCVHVAKALRGIVDPERVRRLAGGLNAWKRAGLPVDGDARAMFAGKVASVALGNGSATPRGAATDWTAKARIDDAARHSGEGGWRAPRPAPGQSWPKPAQRGW